VLQDLGSSSIRGVSQQVTTSPETRPNSQEAPFVKSVYPCVRFNFGSHPDATDSAHILKLTTERSHTSSMRMGTSPTMSRHSRALTVCPSRCDLSVPPPPTRRICAPDVQPTAQVFVPSTVSSPRESWIYCLTTNSSTTISPTLPLNVSPLPPSSLQTPALVGR
jgi:hypothetical protein